MSSEARGEANGPKDGRGYLGENPPPIAATPWRRRVFVDRFDALRALGDGLRGARRIAIDAEFVQTYARGSQPATHRLALLQFAYDNDFAASFVVDTLRLPDLSPLVPALDDPAILKLFHGISADARMLATRGLEARHVLDLEAVSRSVFGQRESGLQAMASRALGVRLDKTLQRADWARRPLTPAMVAYAARDAEITFLLYDWLAAHYPDMIALYEDTGDSATTPAVAAWIAAFLENPRGRTLDTLPVSIDASAQERATREAFMVLRNPALRTRLLRLAAELNLRGLEPEIFGELSATTSEQRAGAARALGRLRARAAVPQIEQLLADPVWEVRQAARTALDLLDSHGRTPPARASRAQRVGAGAWTVGGGDSDNDSAPADGNDWRTALRAQFGIAAPNQTDSTASND